MNTIGQILGFFFFITLVLSFQFKEKKKLLITRIISGIFATLHYFLIGGMTGSLSEFVSIFVNVFSDYLEKKPFYQKGIVIVLFSAFYIGIAIYGYRNIGDLLPPIACIISVIAILLGTTKQIRFSQFIISPMFLVYNIMNTSYAGILTEVFVLSSCIIGILRLDRRGENK